MVSVVKILLLVFMLGTLLWLMVRLIKGGNGGKVFWGSALMGLAALVAVSIVGSTSTETLHINVYTIGTASVLGVPGVILMVLVKMLWQL